MSGLTATTGAKRFESLDLARGIAVALMILSHGVVALVGVNGIPPLGLVPVHLVTKFSSSLFILVFGVSIGFAFLPAVGTADWPRKRNRLLLRGLLVFAFYKILTVVEMSGDYRSDQIFAALTYRAFPVYVEILGFYAIALIWVPLTLPLWKRAPMILRVAIPVAMAALAHGLYMNFDFWGIDSLKAILVEHEDHYTWGQLSRGPLIFVGFFIGEGLRARAASPRAVREMATGLLLFGGALAAAFVSLSFPYLAAAFESVARNHGKHPPETGFVLFSLSGALVLLGASLAGGSTLAVMLRPVTTIGRSSLRSFIFHILVIFVLYRQWLGLWRNVSYSQALFLATILVLAAALWLELSHWVSSSWRSRSLSLKARHTGEEQEALARGG
jgi:uncharacterized membrane protein